MLSVCFLSRLDFTFICTGFTVFLFLSAFDCNAISLSLIFNFLIFLFSIHVYTANPKVMIATLGIRTLRQISNLSFSTTHIHIANSLLIRKNQIIICIYVITIRKIQHNELYLRNLNECLLGTPFKIHRTGFASESS